MKNLNTKAIMVITIVLTSVFTMPMMVIGEEKDYDDSFNLDQVDVGIFDGFRGGFGAIFSNNLGYAGKILGSVFETLLLQGLDLSSHETLDNVYVLSANTTRTISGVKSFNEENENNKEYYFLPNDYLVPANVGFAYCEITKSGSYAYELEVGAAVTLVIWDNDKSFIDAINRLLGFFKKLIVLQRLGGQISQNIIREGIEILTWFLIHINDIFTGDELFVLNPITWQNLNITPIGYDITKEWKFSGLDYAINESDNLVLAPSLAIWNSTALAKKDNYMEWLLNPTAPGDLAETIWTQFSFDLIQLWIKNFQIQIDVNQILSAVTGGGGSAEQAIAGAFDGCDIEFYLFTHHLAGAFLYDDVNSDGIISSDFVNVTDNADIPILDEAGDPIQIPDSSELSHRLILGTVEEFEFKKPVINAGNKSISWGLTLNNVNISAVPMYVDLDSYMKAPEENLEYIYFGFTFEPKKDDVTGAARGDV